MFKAVIKDILTIDGITQIAFSSDLGDVFMLGLEMSEDIKAGGGALLDFKSSDILLLSELNLNSNLGTRNIFKVKIFSIIRGSIVSNLTLEINSIKFDITLPSNLADKFNPNDEAYALLGETSLYISEFL